MTVEIEKESIRINKGSRGGRRQGAGRPRGAKSATTLEIEAAAKEHAGDALKALVAVAKSGSTESSRVAAAIAILDRGYGRPRQAIQHSGAMAVAAGVMLVPAAQDADSWAREVAARQAALVVPPDDAAGA